MKLLTHLAIAASILLALATLGVIGYEHSVQRRIERLLDATATPETSVRTLSGPVVSERLLELQAELDQRFGPPGECVPGGGVWGAPWQWSDEHQDSLRELADGAAPILDELLVLVRTPEFRAVIDDDTRCLELAGQSGQLMYSRTWTYRIVGSAVSSARQGDHDRAARLLACAFDLVRGYDRAGPIDRMIRSANYATVFEAALHILERSPDSIERLREVLDPRLAELGQADPKHEAFWCMQRSEFEYALYQVRASTFVRRLALCNFADREAEDAEAILRAGASAPESEALIAETPSFEKAAGLMRQQSLFHRRLGLLRASLATLAFRQTRGEWPHELAQLAWYFPRGIPIDSLTGEPFRFLKSEDSAALKLPTADSWSEINRVDPFYKGTVALWSSVN